MLWDFRTWSRFLRGLRRQTGKVTGKPPRRKVLLEIEPLERRFLMTTVGFSTSSPSVLETAGNATITVTLDASSSQTITVGYATSSGTASAPANYSSVSGTLTFSPGDTTKTFLVPITDNDQMTSDKTVNLTLSNPTNASLRFPPSATLTINHTTPTSWATSAAQAASDPLQGQTYAFGPVALSPLTGAVRVSQPLDLGLSADYGRFALVYDSSSVDNHPVFNATFASDAGGPVPSSLSLQLTWNGTTQSAVTFSTSGHSAGDSYALAARVNNAVSSSGAYPWSLHLIASFSSRGNVDRTVSGTAWAVVNDGTDPFGKGWSLAGLDHLVGDTNSTVWVSGRGGALYFAGGLTSPPNETGSLVSNGDGTFTYTGKDQSHEYFDSSGNELRFVDTYNRTTTFTYSSGRLSTIQNPDGSVGTFTYDGSNLLQTITAPGNRVTTLTHNGSGDLTAITDAAGNERDFTYSGAHRLLSDVYGPLRATFTYDSTTGAGSSVDRGLGNTLSLAPAATQGLATSPAINSSKAVGVLTDALSQKTTYTVDSLGRTTQLQTPDGATQNWTLNSAGRPTAYTDPLNRTTTMTYNSSQDLTRIDHPDGSNEQFQYDSAFHRITQYQDTLNHLTTYTRESGTGNLLSVRDPLNEVTTFTWLSSGLLETVTDPLHNTTTFQWDGNRRLQDTIDALNQRSTFSYDSAGNVQTLKDSLNRVTTFTHDGMRRLLTMTDANGGVSSYAYNALGEVTSATDPLGHVTQVTYNQLGLPSSVTQAVGTSVARTLTYTYDALGRPVTQTDANNHTATFGYDAVGRLQTETSPVGGVTTYSYDLAGQNTFITDPLNHTSTFTYNSRGWVTVMRDALNNVTTAVYDTEGNTLAIVDPRGNRTTYTYDAVNRLISAQDALNHVGTWVYDAAGNVQAAVDARGNRTTFSYDALNRWVQTQDAVGNRATVVYDAVDNPIATVDARGNRTTVAYDALDRPYQTTDALGGLATVVYDANSNILALVDPRGDRTTFAYDALDRPYLVTNPVGGLATIVYDAADNIAAEVNPLGNRTTFTYDAANRLTQIRDPLGGVVTVAYDAADNRIAQTDQRGNTTTFAYDALNRLQQVTDPLGNRSTMVYDAAGNLLALVNALGNRTTLAYDAVNRPISQTTPLGFTTTVSYDAAGNVSSITNPRNYTTTLTYDAVNRLTQTQNALSGVATFVYDSAGNRIAQVDPLGNRSTFSYDALNRLTAATNPLNFTTTLVYDAAGNVVRTIDSLGFTTTLSYDALNRRVTSQDPGGGTFTTVYDAVGNVVNTIDALNQKSTYTYDSLHRLTQTTDPRGDVTTLLYDGASNVVGLIDPVGNRTTFVYDALNRLTQQTDPLNKSATFAYDAISRMTSTTDRLGRRRDFAYDAENRLSTETWLASGGNTVQTLTYTYDSDDNLLTAANANGTLTFTYDALDRASTRRQMFGLTLTYTYDAAGNRTRVEDSLGGVLTSTYDAAHELTFRELHGGGNPIHVSLGYTARGQLDSINRYTGPSPSQLVGQSQFTYDGSGQLTHLQHKDGSSTNLANFTYTYDAIHRLLTETRNGSTTSYSYDSSNQLTNDSRVTYTYDAVGNRTMSGYTTGTGNRLTSDGTWTYSYDDEGNLTKKSKGANAETWTYGYDHDNRMTWAEKRATDGGTLQLRADYKYDALGNRIEVDVDPDGAGMQGTTVTRYGYDGGNVWADLDGSNALVTRRLYLDGPDQVVARIAADGTAAWYLTDRQGSVRDLADGTGAVQEHVDYDGFGNIVTDTNASFGDRYKYTGRELDSATGLQYNRERYYDPVTGRWTSQDPLGFAGGDSNLYRYVGNDTMNLIDPSGLQGISRDGSPRPEAGQQAGQGMWWGMFQTLQYYTTGFASDVINVLWNNPADALTLAGEGLHGANDGSAMVLNGMTFGLIPPLDNYVNDNLRPQYGDATVNFSGGMGSVATLSLASAGAVASAPGVAGYFGVQGVGTMTIAQAAPLMASGTGWGIGLNVASQIADNIDNGRNFYEIDPWQVGVSGLQGAVAAPMANFPPLRLLLGAATMCSGAYQAGYAAGQGKPCSTVVGAAQVVLGLLLAGSALRGGSGSPCFVSGTEVLLPEGDVGELIAHSATADVDGEQSEPNPGFHNGHTERVSWLGGIPDGTIALVVLAFGVGGWWFLHPDASPSKRKAAVIDAVFGAWGADDGEDQEPGGPPKLRHRGG
jgi:RHS repeat-associated protein